jgi:hypothetical protein
MPFSSIALLIASFDAGLTSLKTGWQSLLADPSGTVLPEEPTTLMLAFAGAVTLSIYALVTGYRGRKRENVELGQAEATTANDSIPIRRDAA